MVRPCCICGVKKNSEAAANGIRFFKFPSAKSESHSNWIKTIRHHSTKISRQFTPRRNSIVCSSHFEDSCFNRSYRKLQLKQGSIPTIFKFDDSSKQVASTQCDEASKVEEEKEGNSEGNTESNIEGNTEGNAEGKTEGNAEGNTSTSAMRDYVSDGSSSLSPPVLVPLQDVNSDFEETIEDPPDLELYEINRDYDESTGLTSFADLDMIKMDHIGSVADILGPDPYMQDESIVMDERPDSSIGEERDEVDGQTILSFTSAEEMHEFAHREASSRLTKTNDFRQIKGWRNKFQQLTPSLSPSPCSSPVSIPARSAVSASENSKSPLPSHFSRLRDIPSTSFEVKNDKKYAAMCEKMSPNSNKQRPTSPVEEAVVIPSEETVETLEEKANLSLETTVPLDDVITHPEEMVEPSEETAELEETVEPLEETAEREETAGLSDESTEAFPDLGVDGSISYDYAKFAASAACFPFGEKRGRVAKKADNPPPAIKKVSLRPKNSATPVRPVKQLAVQDTQILPNVDIDEVPSSDIIGFDDSNEDVLVQEEEYVEVYDVPGNLELPTVDCGQLFCRLGCICDTIVKTKNRPKMSMEHCGLPECMLQCVCGYQQGKPSSRKCFARLLKGNESFYSKINWSGERRRRERRVPERFSEFHLGNESSSSVSNRSSEEFKPVELKSKNSYHRASSNASRPSSPFKNASPPQQGSMPQSVVRDSPSATRKWEPFRVKVCADEIKLLRWDSFVSLSKVYVAPDHDIFCMEHTMYGCPCIETDRRIIRIASKYVPLPLFDTTRNAEIKSPTSSAKKFKARNVTNSPTSKNVAKKHTNPNMRFATKSKVTEETAEPAPQEPVPKTSSLSKMRKLLSDERFQLQKLMTEEKIRTFDEEVDLTVRQGQTVQLVAWIRFHRIYHAGRIHIRFLSRRAGPVILVMRPTEIVAADITCDIQDMKCNNNSPEIVKELLDPCISPEETSRYAFLLCDGVKWELVGCLSLKASNDAPTSTATTSTATTSTATTSTAPPSVPLDTPAFPQSSPPSRHSILTNELPPVVLEEQDAQRKRITSQMKFLAKMPNRKDNSIYPSPIERSSALELKRLLLEQRLSVINSKLTLPQPKQSVNFKQLKHRSRALTAPILPTAPVVEKTVTAEELPPLSLPEADPSIQAPRPKKRTWKRKPDMNYLIPDQCILPDDLEDVPNVSLTETLPERQPKSKIHILPDLAIGQLGNEFSQSLYPAAEKLAMFSRLIQNSRNDSFGGGNSSNFDDTSMLVSDRSRPAKRSHPKVERLSLPVAVPTPLIASECAVPNKPPSEVTVLKLQPIGSSLPSGVTGQNTVRRIRILTPQSNGGGGGNSLVPVLTSRNGLEPTVIQQQRLHWSSKGVKPPVNTKCAPTPSISESLITVLPIPTPAVVGQNVPALPLKTVDASGIVQCADLVPNQDGKTPLITSALPIPDWSTQLLMKANADASENASNGGVKLLEKEERAVKEREQPRKSTSPPIVIAESSTEAESSTSCVFPKISTAEVITVKSPPGNASYRLKIILEAMEGEHRDLCPNRASMILPLHNIDDQWCIVSIDHVPDSGFQVPGVTVFIPREMLGRAASTAIERKARVSLSLHFKLKNEGSALKSGFEVYGTHQLPRHVFLGPFPFNYLESCAPVPMLNSNVCMSVIKLTKSIPSSVADCDKEVKQLKPTEQIEEAIQSPVAESTVNSLEPVSDSPTTIVDDDSAIKTLTSSIEATSGVEETLSSVATGVPERTLLCHNPKDSESDGIEIVDEKVSLNPDFLLQLPASSLLRKPTQSETMKRTPMRMFVARTPGLPPVNIKLFSENSVVVDHPFLHGEKKMFTSIDNAKTWLQTLAIRNCKSKGLSSTASNSGSDKSKTSNSTEDSFANSEFTEDEEIDVCSRTQGESQEQEETIDSASTTSRSPKRIRRLTEKARILAATKSKSHRNSDSTHASSLRRSQDRPPQPRRVGPSRKNSIQRMLHIQKEQERRGLLGKLIRDLDELCAPGIGPRAKIVVLKNATTIVKHLEQQAKAMENVYHGLKLRRTALLTQREQTFNKLPSGCKQIFSCLMDSVPLPSRHLTMTVSDRSKRCRTSSQTDDQQSRNRVAVVGPNNALLSESVNRDMTQGYVLTGVES